MRGPGVAAGRSRKELPWSWRGAILGLALVQFVFAHGLPWRSMFDWDRPIWGTYASIPVLVFAALAIRRELGLVPWFLHSLEIAAAKFWITAGLLLALLIARDDVPRVDPTPFPRPIVASAPAAAPAPRGADAPTGADVSFVVAGGRMLPGVGVIRAGQRVSVRSVDGALHSAHVRRADGSSLVNLAVTPSGEPAVFALDDATGEVLTLDCAVHGASERAARLLVLPQGDVTVF